MSRPPGEAPDVAEDDDRSLLRRHAAGDRDAFPELVRRHRDRMWRVALRTVGDADDAADALQDALLSAHRSAGGFRGDAAVTTWLHRIVVNACLDQVRRNASRRTTPLDDDPAALDRPAPDVIGTRETASEVLAALRRLPVEQTAAIVLVDIEGYPVAEVAEVLEVPVGTVKSRCARGRARLAELLRHLDPHDPEETGRSRNPAAAAPVQRDGHGPDETGEDPA